MARLKLTRTFGFCFILLPVPALASKAGGESRAPIGWAIGVGLLLGTVLTRDRTATAGDFQPIAPQN